MVHFLGARRHLVAAAAVHHGHVGAQALRRARGVHGHIAAAHHHALLAGVHRRLVLGEQIRLHEVHAGQQLACHRHAVETLALDAQVAGQARARAHEHGVEAAVLHELVDVVELAHQRVHLERHALVAQLRHLALHEVLRQAELGDAVGQHAAHLV